MFIQITRLWPFPLIRMTFCGWTAYEEELACTGTSWVWPAALQMVELNVLCHRRASLPESDLAEHLPPSANRRTRYTLSTITLVILLWFLNSESKFGLDEVTLLMENSVFTSLHRLDMHRGCITSKLHTIMIMSRVIISTQTVLFSPASVGCLVCLVVCLLSGLLTK